MLAIAGQTGGPNGLTFFEGTHGYPGVTQAKKIRDNFFKIRFFFSKIK